MSALSFSSVVLRAIASCRAAMERSRPTKSGTTWCGKTTMSRSGRRGSVAGRRLASFLSSRPKNMGVSRRKLYTTPQPSPRPEQPPALLGRGRCRYTQFGKDEGQQVCSLRNSLLHLVRATVPSIFLDAQKDGQVGGTGRLHPGGEFAGMHRVHAVVVVR